jgi:NTP pyrophosphatase (non-canonical NTP hydrolase)
MNQDLIDFIKVLTKNDKKTLSQKALKATEEIGELARAVLPFESAYATTHRFVERGQILEETADGFLCLLSIALELGYDFSDFEEMVRHKAKYWAELQQREADAKWPVPFEMHVTVRDAERESFKVACAKLAVKPLLLDLQNEGGKTVFHDLMTSCVHLGNNTSAYTEVKRISEGLTALGFNVVREKIEAAPWHPAAPSRKHGNPHMPKDCYFECHFAVIASEESMETLRKVSAANSLHLSRNVFKRIDDKQFKIMTTLRSYDARREDFEQDVENAKTALQMEGFQVDKVIVEFSVFDTKVSHDASWITKAA